MNIGALSGSVPAPAERSAAPSSGSTGGGFARVMDEALQRLTEPAQAAEQAVNDLALGRTDNLHQVLLTVSQADLMFRIALEIRNKLTEAYQEIQRMQV